MRFFTFIAEIPGKFWVALASIIYFVLVFWEGISDTFVAPVWFVQFPTGGFYFILGLYVASNAGPGVVGAAKYYIDSVFNSLAGSPPHVEKKEAA